MTPPVRAEPALNLKHSCIYDENLMGMFSFPCPWWGGVSVPATLALSEPMLCLAHLSQGRAESLPGSPEQPRTPAAVFQLVLGQWAGPCVDQQVGILPKVWDALGSKWHEGSPNWRRGDLPSGLCWAGLPTCWIHDSPSVPWGYKVQSPSCVLQGPILRVRLGDDYI